MGSNLSNNLASKLADKLGFDLAGSTGSAPDGPWRESIPSLEADWRYGFGEDTTGGILTWTDQVNGYTAVAPAAINSPTDGGDGWLFDQSVNNQYIDSNDAALLSNFDGAKPCTFIAIVDSVPASSEWVVSVIEGSNNYYGLFYSAVSALTRRFVLSGDSGGDSLGGRTVSGTFTVALTYDGTTLRSGHNGALSVGTVRAGDLPTLADFRIGAAYNQNAGVNGKIKEVIACSAALSESELLEIHQQLAIEQLLALNPTALYVAHPDYLTLDGSNNVEVWADAVDPEDETRWMEQTTAGSRPAFVASSSMPSGISAVQGDGVADILTNTTHTALLAAFDNTNYETYTLLDKQGDANSNILGVTEGTNARKDGLANNSAGSYFGRHNTTNLGLSDSGSSWVRVSYDGSTLSIQSDDVAEATTAVADSYVAQVANICGRGQIGAPDQFSLSQIAAWVVFDRQLTAGERTICEALLAGLGGL